MKDIATLEQLGLTANEAKVYLHFLYFPNQTAAAAARELNLDKSSCYRAVESLHTRQMLIITPRKRGSTYTSVNPEILKYLIDKQKKELDVKASALDMLISRITSDVTANEYPKTHIKIEKGIQAIINLMEDRLKLEPKLMRERWFTAHPHVSTPEYEKYVRDYAQRRVKKGIHIHGLYSLDDLDTQYPELMRTSKKYLKEVRAWPKDLSNTDHLFNIYADKVAFIAPTKDDLTVITIQEPIFADLMRDLFDFVWKQSQPIN